MRDSNLIIAELIDAYRIVPRVLMFGYAALLWESSRWFMLLAEPTSQQTTFIGLLWGSCGLITKWYFDTGRKWTS